MAPSRSTSSRLRAIARAIVHWVFLRPKFCCCIPIRWGVFLMSLLYIGISALLSFLLWFEVSSDSFMSNGEKAGFAVAALIETCLCIASILGFIGICTRKQFFVNLYALFIYFHFVLNLAFAIYLLYMVTHVANIDIYEFCEEGIRNTQAQGQCKGLLNIAKGVYWAVILLLLAVEAYAAIMITRYGWQLNEEKTEERELREQRRERAYDAYHKRFTSIASASDAELLIQKDFNPYEAYAATPAPAYSPRRERASYVGVGDIDWKALGEKIHGDAAGSRSGSDVDRVNAVQVGREVSHSDGEREGEVEESDISQLLPTSSPENLV